MTNIQQGEEYKPLPHLKLTVNRPGLAYGLSCGAHCLNVLIFIVLTIVLGSSFLPFTTNVPLYLPNNVVYERMDAVIVGKEDADYSVATATTQLTQSVYLSDDDDESHLELIYVAKDGNIFTTQHLQSVWDIENHIRNTDDFRNYCLIDWTEEDYAVQELATVTGDYSGVESLNEHKDQRDCIDVASALWACDPSLGLNCSNLNSFPTGVLNCLQDTKCSPDEMILDNDFVRLKVDQYGTTNPLENSIVAQFYRYPESSFGAGVTTSDTLRSEFFFGFPLSGYDSVNSDIDSQEDKLGEWLFSNFNSYLMDLSPSKLDVWFDGFQMYDRYIQEVLPKDSALMICSFFFVYFYISFMEGSWFIATMGMGQIVMCFAPAYLLYYLVFQQRYFGIFNILSMFIILGIGADDIFVFLDTWRQSSSAGIEVSESTENRLSWTWRRAANAMLVTSLTTMVSFLSNSTSQFPAISTFGIFAAMLVLCNYCSVIIYWPTVVMYYHQTYEKKVFCFGIGDKLSAFWKSLHHDDENAEEEDDGGVDERIGGPERWFRDVFAPFVTKRRILLLIFFTLLMILFLSFAVQLKTDPDPPQFFPSGTNYQEFNPTLADYYVRGGSVFSIEVKLVWGFDHDEPIDRSGTNPSDEADRGSPNWSEDFNVAKGAQCVLHLCQDAQLQNETRNTGGPPDWLITCWMIEFKDWMDATQGEDVWFQTTGPDGNDTLFYILLESWLMSDQEIYSKWKPYIYAEQESDGTIILRFTYASLKLTSEYTIDFNDGIDLYNNWEDWWDWEYQVSPCAEVSEYVQGFQYADSWHYFFLQQRLIYEAFAGIFISLALALVVLTFATGNVIVASITTFVILCIVVSVIGSTVMLGYKLGMIESINFVMVPGMAVDYVAHLAEGYCEAHPTDKRGRLRHTLTDVGISVVSGAISTLGATSFLFFALILFFKKFGTFIFITIGISLIYSLFMFSAISATFGPQNETGKIWPFFHRIKAAVLERLGK